METNNLKFIDTIIKGNEKTVIEVRLNDECNNKHQDFAITCDIYKKSKNGKWEEWGRGANHDHIHKVTKRYDLFILLHLCDYNGVPMHAVANGFYHLKQSDEPMKPAKFCKYYRVTPEQYEVLKDSEHQLEYAINLKELGILAYWKDQAAKGIKLLEELTGNEFINDSKKSQYDAPEKEKVEEFHKQKAEGYYSDANKLKRKEAAKVKIINDKVQKFTDRRDEQIKKANIEYAINIFMLTYSPVENWIYYNHTNEVCFNWIDYEKKITQDEFNQFNKSINKNDLKKLPKNIKFKI